MATINGVSRATVHPSSPGFIQIITCIAYSILDEENNDHLKVKRSFGIF